MYFSIEIKCFIRNQIRKKQIRSRFIIEKKESKEEAFNLMPRSIIKHSFPAWKKKRMSRPNDDFQV